MQQHLLKSETIFIEHLFYFRICFFRFLLFHVLSLQRAMRVRSHSMETMVGSHRHRSPGVGGGVPASLSGGGLPQSTSDCTKSTFTVSEQMGKFGVGKDV